MDSLPLEVMQAICEPLASSEPRRRTLLAFALTSKVCCAATAREKFSRICIKVRSPTGLLQDVERLREMLAIGDRKRYVRKVKITGSISLAAWSTKAAKNRLVEAPPKPEQPQSDDGEDDEEDPFSDVPNARLKERYKGPDRPLTYEEQLRYNNSWEKFCACVFDLPIVDFIWASPDPVAPCIISALHCKRPKCRLHVHTFHLPSLYYGKTKPVEVDPDDYVLATSPCLHSITAACSP